MRFPRTVIQKAQPEESAEYNHPVFNQETPASQAGFTSLWVTEGLEKDDFSHRVPFYSLMEPCAP